MHLEIERKFLVRADAWRAVARDAQRMSQGYLANTSASSVRVRIVGEAAFLSVKAMTPGPVRAEYEYPVPLPDGRAMLESLCLGSRIEKTRHRIAAGRHVYEVDEFHGDNAGLVVAEVELQAPDDELELPAWLGDEVTEQLRYYNFRLAVAPFSGWPAAARHAAARGRHLDDDAGEARA